MKKYFENLLREHFSYSAKEKRGMLVLAGILFCLLAFRAAAPSLIASRAMPLNEDQWEEGLSFFESQTKTAESNHPNNKVPFEGFYFDPNTISESEMLMLRLSPKQAASWIKYRSAGAVFRKTADLKKLFFMDEERYALWEPWIRMESIPVVASAKEDKREVTYLKPDALLQLNHCDSTELIRIRGIGAFTASKVLKYRNWLGGFVSYDQLKEIKGLRQEQIDTLIKHTRIDPAIIRKIHINEATEEELKSHPYIRYKSKVIIRYRASHGDFANAEALLLTGVIDTVLMTKLKPYLRFDSIKKP